MDARIILSLFLGIIVGSIGIVIAKPWDVPEKKIERWKRSLIVGLFTGLALPLTIIIMRSDFLIANSQVEITRFIGSLVICLGMPAGIIATIGFYYSYRQLEWLTKIKVGLAKKRKHKS